MTNQDYRLQLTFIRKTIELNDFQMFFTMRDLRNKTAYKKFRSTSADCSGYLEREKSCKRLMDTFRRAYGLRGGKGNKKEFYYFAVNEAGVGEKHWLSEDSGHLHICVGWAKDSRYYSNPRAYLDRFIELVNDKYSLRWASFCCSLKNKNRKYTIENKERVARYMGKAETGTLNGGNFSKEPFWDGPIQLPADRDLVLDPLPLM